MARSNAAYMPRQTHESQVSEMDFGEQGERGERGERNARHPHPASSTRAPDAAGAAQASVVPDEAGSPPGRRSLGVVWRQAGATVVVPAGAPDPESHRPRFSEEAIERVLAAKRDARERGIEQLHEEAVAALAPDAIPPDRFVSAIRWDSELAPRTTNRTQLAEIGVDVPDADDMPAHDLEVHRVLWTVIYGLARLGIFLVETDGTSDRSMLALLSGRILEDEVGDIPPNGDMSEFIALCSGAMCDREAGACEEEIDSPDGLQGPFEPDEEDDGSWDPHVAFDAAIEAVQVDARPSGPIVERAHEHDGGAGSDPGAKLASDTQIPQFAPSPVRRDHFLPRPYRSGFACP